MKSCAVSLVLLALLVVAPACTPMGSSLDPPEKLLLTGHESKIWFIGIKNGAIPVPGWLGGLTGVIDVTGHRGWVEIEIATLDTGDAERDGNILKHLFAAADHPRARFAIKDATGALELPAIGGSVDLQVSGLLTLRGAETPLLVPARLTREGVSRVRVQTREPVVLTAEQLGLQPAFQILQAVCGHKALSTAVPIQFDLVFEGE